MPKAEPRLIRAVLCAAGATSLLLSVALVPAVAAATDARCGATSIPDLPRNLHVEVVDLVREQAIPADNLDLADSGDLATEPAVPDLSSRARSLAILREIFGEPVGDDDSSDLMAPAYELADGERADSGSVPLRPPSAGLSDSDGPDRDRSGADDNAAPTPMPGVSEPGNQHFRDQMYRTDI